LIAIKPICVHLGPNQPAIARSGAVLPAGTPARAKAGIPDGIGDGLVARTPGIALAVRFGGRDHGSDFGNAQCQHLDR